jgi:hypothetical protein
MTARNVPARPGASSAGPPAAVATAKVVHAPTAPATAPATATDARTAATPTATTAAPIPFRRSEATSGPEVFGVLVTTLLLLAAFYGLAWYARKRGWLQRWGIAAASSASAPTRRLQVLERLPLSRRTTLFRVRDGEREFLLAETSAGAVQLAETTAAGEGAP